MATTSIATETRAGDPGNNAPENIAFLCRHHHMEADGRLEKFNEMRLANIEAMKRAPKPCKNCGVPYKPLRRGRCRNCAAYYYRHGEERRCYS